ncbi:MAG: DNA primase DnaG [Thermoplasmatota archaeon]
MDIDPTTTKYVIKCKLKASGVVEKPDVVGAIFGQTEGLLGDELDLRDLQKSGRMGRIEVEVNSSKGKSAGTVTIPSSLDLVETSILAAALETIDRVGPCKAEINVEEVRDVREAKRQKIIDRAKELLSQVVHEGIMTSTSLTESVRQEVQMEEVQEFGEAHSPAGPNVKDSDAIVVVEGRSDVLNLLKYGIKNAIAVEGTNVPKSVQDLTSERVTTAFVDGDRGGSLILKELLETADIDYVAEAPQNSEVEELTQKQIIKSLRSKIPIDQYLEMYDLEEKKKKASKSRKKQRKPKKEKQKKKEEEKPKEPSKGYQRYKELLQEVKGEKKALLLNGNDEIQEELPTRDLSDSLKDKEGKVEKIIFDGIITQRLVDVASSIGVKKLVARRIGNIPKLPTSMELLSQKDL